MNNQKVQSIKSHIKKHKKAYVVGCASIAGFTTIITRKTYLKEK